MKKLQVIFALLVFTFCFSICNAQNVGIGTNTPKAALDVTSTNNGFLPPRMTYAQRSAIQNPAAGLIVYCTNCGEKGEMQFFNGSDWTNMIGGPTTLVDYDGNSYPTIKICNQIWTAKNLDVSSYTDGTPIPEVKDPNEWANLTTGAWCYYENNTQNGKIYGKLYNYYAIEGIYDQASYADFSLRKRLIPEGWHLPLLDEYNTLVTCLGGTSLAGGKMKTTGTKEQSNGLWLSPNTDATNSSGFSALPGGNRKSDVSRNLGTEGNWWVLSSPSIKSYIGLYNNLASISFLFNSLGENFGFSIRCVKD